MSKQHLCQGKRMEDTIPSKGRREVRKAGEATKLLPNCQARPEPYRVGSSTPGKNNLLFFERTRYCWVL